MPDIEVIRAFRTTEAPKDVEKDLADTVSPVPDSGVGTRNWDKCSATILAPDVDSRRVHRSDSDAVRGLIPPPIISPPNVPVVSQ